MGIDIEDIVLVCLMWGAKDTYHVKTEINIMASIWIVVMLIWIPYSQLHIPFLKTFSPSLWIMIGLFCTFGVGCIFPLVLVYLHPVPESDSAESSEKFSWLMDQLQNVRFRYFF